MVGKSQQGWVVQCEAEGEPRAGSRAWGKGGTCLMVGWTPTEGSPSAAGPEVSKQPGA